MLGDPSFMQSAMGQLPPQLSLMLYNMMNGGGSLQQGAGGTPWGNGSGPQHWPMTGQPPPAGAAGATGSFLSLWNMLNQNKPGVMGGAMPAGAPQQQQPQSVPHPIGMPAMTPQPQSPDQSLLGGFSGSNSSAYHW